MAKNYHEKQLGNVSEAVRKTKLSKKAIDILSGKHDGEPLPNAPVINSVLSKIDNWKKEANNIKSYFNERRLKCLSVKSIEEEAGLPLKTLDHFLAGRRELPGHAVEKLLPILRDFGYTSF